MIKNLYLMLLKYLGSMVEGKNDKNFIIYMDFNVKYEKDLYTIIKDKVQKI